MSNNSDALGCLVVLVVVIVAIYFLSLYVVLPSIAIVIGGIAIAGALSGIWIAASNTIKVLIEAHKVVR